MQTAEMSQQRAR